MYLDRRMNASNPPEPWRWYRPITARSYQLPLGELQLVMLGIFTLVNTSYRRLTRDVHYGSWLNRYNSAYIYRNHPIIFI